MPLLMGGGQPPAQISANDLSRIAVPTRVAFGDRTRRLFELASHAVASAIPCACLQTVPDADHMLPETEPRRFVELLLDWLGS